LLDIDLTLYYSPYLSRLLQEPLNAKNTPTINKVYSKSEAV